MNAVKCLHNFSRLMLLRRSIQSTCLRASRDSKMGGADDIPEDLLQFMHGRNKKERIDSVSVEVLKGRRDHLAKCEHIEVPMELMQRLESLGLGTKRRRLNVFSKVTPKHAYGNAGSEDKLTPTAAGGHGTLITSAAATRAEDWPVFDHILPEVAFAGHSNNGKSTLVNAMIGVAPRLGPASVSDRAGWTDQICFYRLGKRPPKLTLVDLPGYGHAVAKPADMKFWKLMTRSYLGGRLCLSCCCILVDCTRGLCDADISLLRFLHQNKVPWHIVLTKSDLLSPIVLAQSMLVVQRGLDIIFGQAPNEANPDQNGDRDGIPSESIKVNTLFPNISPVSASTGAGIASFWETLCNWVDRDAISKSSSETAVREHRNASAMRRSQVRSEQSKIQAKF